MRTTRSDRNLLLGGALICLLAGGCAAGWSDYQTDPPVDLVIPRGEQPLKVEYNPSGPSPRVAVIHVVGEIHEATAAEYEVQVKALIGADYLVVDIDSPGGYFSAAKEMMVTTLAAPASTICVAHTAASGAFGLFEACGVRMVLPHSELMLHRAKLVQPAGSVVEWIQDSFDIGRINDRWLHLACARLSISYEQCSDAVAGDREMWLNPAEAIAAGAADDMAVDLAAIVQELREP